MGNDNEKGVVVVVLYVKQGTRSASVIVQKGLQCKKMFQGRGLAADITAVKRNSRGFTHSVHTNL